MAALPSTASLVAMVGDDKDTFDVWFFEKQLDVSQTLPPEISDAYEAFKVWLASDEGKAKRQELERITHKESAI
jgi:hypothetical protein